MSKGYEDLSRRGLIKLNKDFDKENDAALLHYLSQHDDEYENIRVIEKLTVKADNVVETIKKSGFSLKAVAQKESVRVIDAVIDAVVSASDEAEVGLVELKEKVK